MRACERVRRSDPRPGACMLCGISHQRYLVLPRGKIITRGLRRACTISRIVINSTVVLPARRLNTQPAAAGYDAPRLDPILAKHISACEVSIYGVNSLKPVLEQAISNLQLAAPGTDSVQEAERVAAIFEKVSRASLNLVKATDELTRLRSFLDGGPDSRPDLTSRGELELRVIVLEAVKALGWKVVEVDGKQVTA